MDNHDDYAAKLERAAAARPGPAADSPLYRQTIADRQPSRAELLARIEAQHARILAELSDELLPDGYTLASDYSRRLVEQHAIAFESAPDRGLLP